MNFLKIENNMWNFTILEYNSKIPYQLFKFFMGQETLIKLKNNIEQKSNAKNLTQQSTYEFMKNIIENSEQSSKELLTVENIHEHLTNYLNSLCHTNPKRRRSYQILQCETAKVEKIDIHQNVKDCKLLQDEMQWAQEMQQIVRINITEIMATQKVFKIRQNFRKLILQLLKIENLWIYIVHLNGRIEFHDFQNNFITDIIENIKSKSILSCIQNGFNNKSINDIIQLFDLKCPSEEEGYLYKWSVISNIQRCKIGFLWKNYESEQFLEEIPIKMAQKIISITLISSFQEETTVIQNYSKNLLDILQLCIKKSQLKCCWAINPIYFNFQDLQKWLYSRTKQACQDAVTLRVNAFQQLKYELLQRIRMYKKYVCEQDKIFMDFDEQAVLAFVSNNISHRYSSNLQKLYQKRKLFVENIFKQDKLINNFMKKALQKKIKHNKIYELDFQTKARIQYDGEGRIRRLHVIVEQTENQRSYSSSKIYCSSSTNNLSDQSDQKSQQNQNSHSTLIKNLQKQNPGILNEGWINLFIKDNQVERRNTHLKNKGKKRSYSLNRDAILSTPNKQSSELNQQLNYINIESTDLNLLKMEEEILEPLVIQIFKKLDFFCTEMVNKQSFQNFLTQIHNGYQHNNNPFHNFTHGVNVMQTCFVFSTTPKIMELLNPFQIFTIVFSGLCHDIGHTGFTNLFEIASGSKKALTYNDMSPLENYHASHTFQILRKPQNNFLKDLNNQEMKEFRKAVISNILYTDIKQHFPLLKKFNSLIKDEVPKTQQFITCLSGMIVHTSDFGGSAKQFQVCKQWSLKVNLEFSNQYKLEGELGLPQTPFMKDLNNPTILSKNQSGFLKVIVLPLYQSLNNFNGTDHRINRMFLYVENNITQWQKINIQSQKNSPPP